MHVQVSFTYSGDSPWHGNPERWLVGGWRILKKIFWVIHLLCRVKLQIDENRQDALISKLRRHRIGIIICA
jgi:hypothetical protein